MSSHEPTDVAAEFLINGSWVDTYGGVDLASRIRGNDAVRITRGLTDQQSATSPVSGVLTLNNRDGLFTDDNPASPLFGLFGLNTQVRVGIKTNGTWDEHVRMADNALGAANYPYTADKASLDITGDIDVRIEFTPDYTRNRSFPLITKYLSVGNQRSWGLFWNSDGQPSFWHSPDGTLASGLSNLAGVTLPERTGRTALRVTLDVNNGAAGHDYKWYLSDSIDGTWTLISSGTVAGTTSIFSGTAELEIGVGNTGSGIFSGYYTFPGKIHAAQVYSGIAGTLVADFRPAGKTLEATSWTDTCASPNTWLVSGDSIRMASDRIRVAGELTSVPDDWDSTGRDVYTPCTLAGILGRYASNKATLGSAIYRFRRNKAGMVGYWPCEDATGSTTIASGLPGGQAGSFASCTFGAVTGLDGSTGAITMTSAPNVSSIRMRTILPSTVDQGDACYAFYFNLATLPPAETVFATIYSMGGTASRWTFSISDVGFIFTAYSSTGSVLDTGSTTFGAGASPLDQWIGMSLELTQEGGNVRWNTSWHAVGTETFYTHFIGGDTYAGVTGQFFEIDFGTPDAAFAGAQIAHVQLANTDVRFSSVATAGASKGWTGETVLARLARLADEENLPFEYLGNPDLSPIMGPQTADTLFNNFVAAATVDAGILGESRDRVGALYVARDFLGNRAQLTYEYDAAHLADVPRPTRDTRNVVNDFTASRPSGSSARYEVTDPLLLNVSDPPDGVGRFERTGAFSVASDDQLPGMAQLQTVTGSWPERRIPNLAVELHRSEIFSDVTLLADTIAWDFGRPVLITNLDDAPMPPGDKNMILFGYTETFDGFLWSIVGNTVPAGPYQVPILGDLSVREDPRLDATDMLHTTTHLAIDTDDTSIVWKTDKSYPTKVWVDSTNYPDDIGGGETLDVKLSGEQITVSSITAPTSSAAIDAGTFENADGGVAGWSASGGSIAQSSTFAFAGTFSARLTVSGSPSQAYIRNTTPIPVVVGKSYTTAMQCRTGSTLTVSATIDWLDADENFLSRDISGSSLASGAFAARTVTGTAPAGAAFAQYGSTITGSPVNGSLLYTDAVTFTSDDYNFQTATVTRSVNTVVKAHDAHTPVFLFEPSYLGAS